jgi:hypothetical protein
MVLKSKRIIASRNGGVRPRVVVRRRPLITKKRRNAISLVQDVNKRTRVFDYIPTANAERLPLIRRKRDSEEDHQVERKRKRVKVEHERWSASAPLFVVGRFS